MVTPESVGGVGNPGLNPRATTDKLSGWLMRARRLSSLSPRERVRVRGRAATSCKTRCGTSPPSPLSFLRRGAGPLGARTTVLLTITIFDKEDRSPLPDRERARVRAGAAASSQLSLHNCHCETVPTAKQPRNGWYVVHASHGMRDNAAACPRLLRRLRLARNDNNDEGSALGVPA